jgi:RNA polymerase sigma-70 factor, ECF subfamily
LENPIGEFKGVLADMTSDTELVTAVLANDHDAFDTLVQRYERAVFAVAVDILRDHHAAQDTAQEVFVQAYQKLGTLRNGSAFGTWILTITRHMACHALRPRPKEISMEAANEPVEKGHNGLLDEESRHLLWAIT